MTRGKNGKFGWQGVIATIVLDLIIWMVLQWIGEKLLFLPVIELQMPAGSIFTAAEGELLFIAVIGVSSFLAALITWVITKHHRKK